MTKKELPQDLDQCHDMILQMYERMCGMEQTISQLVRSQYGRKTEVVDPGQLRLFAEVPQEPKPQPEAEQEVVVVRNRHGRGKPAVQLPRIRKEYVVSTEQLPCPECAKPREMFGQETTEQYDYVPSSVQVIEHVQYKYACKHCSGHVIVAPKPKTLLRKCLATEGMVAEIATRKLGDHLPLNRLDG